jgi:hypothetical protein
MIHRIRTSWARVLATVAALLLGLTPAAGAMPLISEVFYDAPGSDDGFSFVELYGEPGAPVDGLVLTGINGANGSAGPVLPLTGFFGDDGLFVVADVTSAGTTQVAAFDLLLNFDFQNGPDSIVLEDELGVLDAVGYGDFDPDEIFAGEGTPAPDPPAGASIARVFADLDRDDNGLDFVVQEIPTPGFAEVLAVPEPNAGLLAGVGLFVIGRMRRRVRPLAHGASSRRTSRCA